MTLRPGELVGGKYRIVRLIGDGGMGSVYEARHELLGASVALKFLHADLAKRPGLSARFLQEARVSATIQSPHVTRVTDVDTTADGSPYLVMELLTGESLQSLLDRLGKLPEPQAVDFTLQILAGLEAAHALGVVHRDLKPDNVFVTPTPGGPLLKLIDFGIAKLREASEYKKGLTRAGVVMGTAEYMAPEQLYSASEVDHRADIYSLGVMLFEMLSGVRPSDGDSAEAIIANVLSGNIRRLGTIAPELRPGLVTIVERALEPDRERRPASAYDMRVALAEFSGELSHAGRLATNSAPVAPTLPRMAQAPEAHEAAPQAHAVPASTAYGPPPDVGKLPDTVDAPVPVPRTLPPDEPRAVVHGTPPFTSPQPRRARRRSGRGWWIALASLVALGAAALVVAQILQRERRSRPEIPGFTLEPPSPPSTVEPIVIPTPTETPTQTPTVPTATETRQPPPSSPRPPTQSNTGGAPPTFQPLPFPSFALPSTLPPLPSTLPPLPTTLPSFFPEIPGLTPPRSSPTGGGPGQP